MCAGAGRDKKFFVRIIECSLNTCECDMSKKDIVTESLWCKCVATLVQ